MGTEEIGVLVKMYPQYALWLTSGNTAPKSARPVLTSKK